MTDPVIVLDAGVLDRATVDRGFRVVLRELVGDGWDPVVPAVVLAEAITGGPTDAPVNQTVSRLGTDVTDEATARRAGHLRAVAARDGGRRLPSGIDAVVAAHAVRAGRGVVFTTDPGDLRRLLVDHPSLLVARP